MARDKNIIERRNKKIKLAFYKLQQKEPKWTYASYLEELGDMFWLAPKTIGKILNK